MAYEKPVLFELGRTITTVLGGPNKTCIRYDMYDHKQDTTAGAYEADE